MMRIGTDPLRGLETTAGRRGVATRRGVRDGLPAQLYFFELHAGQLAAMQPSSVAQAAGHAADFVKQSSTHEHRLSAVHASSRQKQ
jgi:hypothetical protein